ncbi:hypothetical protein, partial [Halomonas halodenitrificans]|uniref:hypothetical protein n=1 Tax=Halomonas halodenitrificans TaxID=28252 RepID=UPI0004868D9B
HGMSLSTDQLASDIRIKPKTLTLKMRVAKQAVDTLYRMLGLNPAREPSSDRGQRQALPR